MHPAASLIVFTSLSGIGLGLAAVLGLAGLAASPLAIVIEGVVCLGLIIVGTLASTFHLGHPERAWRAFSQWRSSWLSREGVLAAITVLLLVVYFGNRWLGAVVAAGGVEIPWLAPTASQISQAAYVLYSGWLDAWLGKVCAGLALITVFATAMIYASLRTVAIWHQPLTPIMFLAWAVAGGLLLAATLGMPMPIDDFAIAGLLLAAAVKIIWWWRLPYIASDSSPETATGLGQLGEGGENAGEASAGYAGANFGDGKVKLLILPHTESNWLQHEMGFVVARRHALRLRVLALLLAVALPVVILLLRADSAAWLVLASGGHVVGVMIDRWLFFAEAKHTVMLYYGG